MSEVNIEIKAACTKYSSLWGYFLETMRGRNLSDIVGYSSSVQRDGLLENRSLLFSQQKLEIC